MFSLKSKTGREKAAIIVPVIIAAAGGAWGVYQYAVKGPKLEVEYVVCRSDSSIQCPPNSLVIGCDDPRPITRLLSTYCRDFQQTLNASGGHCGHTAWKAKCTVE